MELSHYWEGATCSTIQEIPEILWLCLQQPFTGPYTEPISLDAISYLSKIDFNIVVNLHLGLPSGLFLSGFPINVPYAFLFAALFVLHDLPISSSFSMSFSLYSEKCASYEDLHYVAFSNLLLLPLSSLKIFSSAPCSEMHSVYVVSLILETKFYAHTKFEAKLKFCMS
jgi:hypothetical protein